MRISAVTAMEYLEGFSDADVARQLAFLDLFNYVAVSLSESIQASRIRRQLRLQGRLLPDADILIAACAMQQNEPLLTNNEDHFGRIEGLKTLAYKN